MVFSKMIHLSFLVLLFLLLVPCHGRVLDDPDYNPEDYTDINLFGHPNQNEVEVDCESKSFQVYASIPRSPPARRPYNCTRSSQAPLLASCDHSKDVTVTFNVTLADVVVYYLGVDAHDPNVCHIYRVFSEEDYDISSDSEEEERRRKQSRKEMKLNRQRGTTIPYPPQPTIHSDINDLDETKKRPMPEDVRLLPIDDGEFDDDYSTSIDNEETVMSFEKTKVLSNIIGGVLMKFSISFTFAFLFSYYYK